MIGCLPVDLVKMVRGVVARIDREVGTEVSRVHVALVASQLYEALKIELEMTPSHEPARFGLLAAARDQCHRIVRPKISVKAMAAELAAVLNVLERGPESCLPAPVTPADQRRSQFTVIHGGLSGDPAARSTPCSSDPNKSCKLLRG
jgi:hypothetical protein